MLNITRYTLLERVRQFRTMDFSTCFCLTLVSWTCIFDSTDAKHTKNKSEYELGADWCVMYVLLACARKLPLTIHYPLVQHYFEMKISVARSPA